jgi:hypothetical protein
MVFGGVMGRRILSTTGAISKPGAYKCSPTMAGVSEESALKREMGYQFVASGIDYLSGLDWRKVKIVI